MNAKKLEKKVKLKKTYVKTPPEHQDLFLSGDF